LRNGQEYFFVEDCRAVFITTNTNLVKVVAEYFFQNNNRSAILPCLTDLAITNMLWLKNPTKAPDLPRKRVIADCFATTQPSYDLWDRYLTEIKKLEQDDKITEDDYYLLRYSLDAKSSLMDLTLGQEEAFTQGTVSEILEHVQAKIRADLEAKLREEKVINTGFETKERERSSNLDKRAILFSKIIGWVIRIGLILILSLATLTTFPWGLPNLFKSLRSYVLPVFWIILLVISIDNLWRGRSLEIYIREFEVFISKSIKRLLISLTE
jgi:hypothetical protein